MLGIGFWDWVALGVYLVGITVIGVWTVRRIHDSADFFMGGRSFSKPFMIFFAFGSGTSGNDAVGVSSKTFTNGVSGIWYQFLWLFATPFYWLIAPVFRRMRAITTGDYFEYRYDRSVAGLYALVGVLQLTVNIGVLLKGAGATIEAVSNGAITTNAAILVMTVLFVIYGIAGGLAAAIVTDFIQGILTIILSFIILPFAWKAVGGMAGMREHITNENMFSLVAPGEINGFHIFMFGLSALIGIVTQPHIMGVCAGGRNEMDGRVGFTGGNLLKRVCTIAWMLTGLCAVVYFAGREAEIHPDLIYGTMARELLPLVMPGLVGLFLAALLASIMSSCDAFMVSSAGLFTQNFYRRFIAHDRDEKHYVMVGRITAFVIVVFSIAFSFMFTSVPVALEWFFRVQAVMGAAFWLGLFWRRTTVAGAWAGTLIALALMFVTQTPMFHAFAVEHFPERMIWDDKFRVSYQMAVYLMAGFGSCILVSLFTKRVPDKKLDRVFECLRTPIQPNEPHLEPFTLPPGVEPPPPRKLINHPDLEIPMPSAVGMAGFIVIWGLVGLLVGSVYWIVGWGA
ncbi:MAG: sodium:proline symporter [Candidatus Hydrogenedentota bacterium]